MSDTPRKAHSKSEYKRLTTMGAEVLPPTPPTVTEHEQPHAAQIRYWTDYIEQQYWHPLPMGMREKLGTELRDAAAYIERVEQSDKSLRVILKELHAGHKETDSLRRSGMADALYGENPELRPAHPKWAEMINAVARVVREVNRQEALLKQAEAEAAALREERDRLKAQLRSDAVE